ncbi:MAG: tRNA lysidine(34) synthetase TilS [Candidatus Ventricola sp.]
MTIKEFCLRLMEGCAVAPEAHVLVAVSGGADSTALLCFCAQARASYPLTVSCAHVEHGIRGEAARKDLAFVRALCKERGIPFFSESVDTPGYARAHGCGLEDAARTLRYAALRRMARQAGADVIALAHHAGDQAETVLLHAARGCDVRGLQAMRMRSGDLIRPLLGCTPQELREELRSQGQGWREDESNDELRYARNRVRRRVLPELEQACPGAGAALGRLARAAQRDEDFFDAQLKDVPMHELADGAAMSRAELAGLHPALRSRAIVRLIARAGIAPQSAQTIEAVMAAAASPGAASVNLTGGAHALLGRRAVCAVRAAAPPVDVPLGLGRTDTPFGVFTVREAAPGETGDGCFAQAIPAPLLDGAHITLRREGDTMTPFGRHHEELLSRLLIKAGVEQGLKNSLPVLRGRGGILWAVGLRPGEICRGRDGERRLLVSLRCPWADLITRPTGVPPAASPTKE